MRVFIIDTKDMGPELQGGLIAEVVDTVSKYAADRWGIAADPHTPIGRLAALTAEAGCAPFVHFGGARLPWSTVSTIVSTRGTKRDPANAGSAPFPVRLPASGDRGVGLNHSRIENGGW